MSCKCCKPAVDATTPFIDNRPALSAIDYRIRDYGSFRRAMIERIPSKNELAQWTARDETDYGIAVLDMWAYLGDILTFYQERIANEAFLRTAVHRESVRRLAALLDYRPAPGAAAVAHVAFSLEKGKTLELPVGLRLQSVPGQNEKPQKFETVEAIHADAALNLLRIHGLPVPFNPFAKGTISTPLDASVAPLAAGAALLLFDHLGLEAKSVTAVSAGQLAWQPAIARSDWTRVTTRAVASGRRFALFGSDTTKLTTVPVVHKDTVEYKPRHTDFELKPPNILPLDRAVPDLKAGSRVLLVRAASNDAPAATRYATIAGAQTKPYVMRSKNGDELPSYAGNVTELQLDLRLIGPPVLALDGTPTAFAVADDGAIWSSTVSEPKWRSRGGTNFTEVAACNASGTLFLFGRDANGTLWQKSGAGWTELGTGLDLVRAGVAGGRPYLVARGSDGRARVRVHTGFAWLDWMIPAKGPACDRIATVVNNAGGIELYVRRADKKSVAWTRQLATGAPFQPWQTIPEPVLGLAAAVNQNGSVELFVRRTNSSLARRRRTGNSWSAPVSLEGWIDRLTVIRDFQGRLIVYARGNNKQIYTRMQTAPNAATYSNWAQFTGNIEIEHLTASQQTFNYIAAATTQGTLATWVLYLRYDLGPPVWPIADRRLVSVLELTSEPLPVAAAKYPSSITASPVTVPLTTLEAGRTIILDDSAQQPHVATVTEVVAEGERMRVAFTPDLTRALDDATAVLYGNVAEVTHGETVASQILGSGDAAARFQTFGVPKSPVTHVLQAGARNGVASTLEVRVDGVRWREVESLLDQAPDARVFVTSIDEKNAMTVQFGGDPGARLTTGRNNVTAKYRVGLGAEGNVRAGALTNLLDRPVGLRSAVNPEAASGGAAAEPVDGIRENAPNTVRTFGRIVSLRDFEDAAREHASVAKARATWSMQQNERVVRLTVAANGGGVLTQSALALVVEDLDARRDFNRPMHVRVHENVPFSVHATIQVHEDHLLDDVGSRAAEALASFFSFARRDLGEPIHLSAVYAVLQGVEGVVAVNITRLRRKSGGPELGDHIRIHPYEIATLASPADAVVKTQFEPL